MIKLVKSSFFREKETKAKLVEFINSADMLSMGKQCAEFERVFAKKQQRKFAVFVSSGSSANLVLIQALLNLGRFKSGDIVGISALTWSTNIMPLIQLGLKIEPLDCELNTLNVSPAQLEPRLSSLKGVFLTNVLGFCDRIDEIKRLCEERNVILLEDNCESLGSKLSGQLLGNFGLASTFSFFVGHHLSTIEGGMICTDDEGLYNALIIARAHGWDRNLEPNKQQAIRQQYHIGDFYDKYTFYDLGFNARPTEIQGFLGNQQIEYWDEIVENRQANFKQFQKAIELNSELIPLQISHLDTISNFNMPLVCKNKKSFEKYRHKFEEAEVEIRPIIAGNMTRQPFYKKYISNDTYCPNASQIHECGLYFPNNAELNTEEVALLCNLLKP